MSTAVRDYHKLAEDIKNLLGEDNILSANHCATRLRLTLKEPPSDEVTKKIEQMPAVIQVIQAGGQYQIVIGMHVKDVYEALSGMMTFQQEAPKVKQMLLEQLIGIMSGCIAPIIYLLAAAGLLQGMLIIINLFTDITATGAYKILNMISWTPFTFLPVLIAVTASRHFKCNTFIALWCCLALTHPDWTAIAQGIAEGQKLSFLFLPLTSVTYTSSVIPPLVLVGLLSVLEHWLEKHLPDIIKSIGVPLLSAVIMVPLTIIAIGPVSTFLSTSLAGIYNKLYEFVPWLASGLLGGFWETFVIFGIHWSFAPISLSNYQMLGYDLLHPVMGIAVCAQTAACFAVFLKSKNKQIKQVAGSASLTGIFGITEPAIYGITLRLKKPFIAGCIGGGIGSIVSSFFGARYFVYPGLCGFLSIPNSIYDAAAQARCADLGTAGNFSGSFTGVLLGSLIACVVAFVLVYVIGFDDPKD